MDENQRRRQDFEAQRQRNRDEQACQKRKEQDNRSWERIVDRQAHLAREQKADFERQQAGFEAMGRKQAAKDREEEEYHRQGQADRHYTASRTGTDRRKQNGLKISVLFWLVLTCGLVTGISMCLGESFETAGRTGVLITAFIFLLGPQILKSFGRK